MNKNEFSRVFLSILFMALMFAGTFAVSHAQDQTPKLGGSLVIGMPRGDAAVIGFWVNTDDRSPGSNIFNALIQDDSQFNPLPDLAQSWSFSPDGLTWTFNLVRNATWHDGVPFTSADVKYTYEKLITLTGDGQNFYSKDDLNGIETPDNYTVVFSWKHPYLEAFQNMNVFAAPIGPKHLYDGTDPYKNEWNVKPIGTGPFKFQEWVRGDHITLVKNQNYFKRGLPYLDKVVYRYIPDLATMIAAMKRGDVDYVPGGLPYGLIPEVNKDPAFSPVPIRMTVLGQTLKLMFNLDSPILKDVRVRQAISMAIDRQLIVDKATYGYGKVSKSIFPDTVGLAQYRSPNVPYPKYDSAGAEKLLDDAGYKRGSDGVRFKLDKFLTTSGNPEIYVDPPALIRDMLKKVGIDTTIVVVDSSTKLKWQYVDRPRNFDLAIQRQRAGPTPISIMKTKISQFIRPGIYFNLGYNNSEIDKLFTQVKSASTADEQVKLYRNIDEILCRDVPELWIYDSPYASPRRNTFQGYTQYDVIPESGPTEVVWWTQGTPMVTATATTATTQTMAPTISSEWVVVAVIAVIVLAGAYIAYTRRKKKTT